MSLPYWLHVYHLSPVEPLYLHPIHFVQGGVLHFEETHLCRMGPRHLCRKRSRSDLIRQTRVVEDCRVEWNNSGLPKSIDRCNSGRCLEISSTEEVGDLVDGDHSPWVRTEPDLHRFIVIRTQMFHEGHVEWLQPMSAVWRETDDIMHIVLPG